jgi:nitroreductase
MNGLPGDKQGDLVVFATRGNLCLSKLTQSEKKSTLQTKTCGKIREHKGGIVKMELMEAIKGRRSVGVVKPEEPPVALIEQVLEAATWAPNHHHTEPWKFFVLRGAARSRLGEAMADIVARQLDEQDSEESRKRLERERSKPLRAPVLVAVAVSPSDKPNVVELEEVEAVACAVQNMLLSAHSLGLGAVCRTGEITYEPELKAFFQLSEREKLLGFIYIGYPNMEIRPGARTPFQEKTVWLDQ